MIIIDQKNKNAVKLATKALQEGKIIIIPTDTIYGLAVDGSNPEAVEKLYNLKKRDKNKPIAIFLPKFDFVTEIFELSDLATKISKYFLPGKITIVAKLKKSISKKIKIAHNLNKNNQEFLGFRIPNHNFVEKLNQSFKNVIAVSSANPSEMEVANNQSQIEQYFKNSTVELVIIDKNISNYQLPSTIIKFDNNDYEILREGAISKIEINNIVFKN
ncbi:MAG: threonylcarbamoyl-AMP synthase [Rickettsiales bacterium]|jgi:L-threonylcarbamoyladenylate synthase|nr:threonylcarbamoyl-AMP synthase [Rickettsiales bacterium]